MKPFFIIFCFQLFFTSLFSQDKLPLKAFFNADSTLVGYKDTSGEIVIPAKLNADLGLPETFEDIISVLEYQNDKFTSYFLTRTGKVVAVDSLYFFDNTPDCENEGFIRFHSKETDKMGLLNAQGEIQIPAEYSYISQVKNGMISAWKDATKKRERPNEEHWFWVGGQQLLIDTNNQVLIEDFPLDSNLDFYSVRVDDNLVNDKSREYFKSNTGRTFSFINFDKQFELILEQQLFIPLSSEGLRNICADSIYFYVDRYKQGKLQVNEFLENYFGQVKELVENRVSDSSDFFVSLSAFGLDSYIYNSPSFAKYFNNCGFPREWKYPVMGLYITQTVEEERSQSVLEFLKTDDGYKIINVRF